jgi:hypothetical protein
MTEQLAEKVIHKDGPPWENKRTFTSFEEADVFRKNCSSDESKQVKVKRYVNSLGVETFVVKVRTSPELLTQEDKPKKNKKNK